MKDELGVPFAKSYDWVVEETDKNGDIIDCFYYPVTEEGLTGALRHVAICRQRGESFDFSLHQGLGNEPEGYVERKYAYVDLETGRLPETFSEGGAVPRRFLNMKIELPEVKIEEI